MSYVVGGSSVGVDDGTFIRCPFNSSHVILAQRFPYHFVKCKESYPGVEVTHCPYNAKHCLRKEELQEHITICPQRSKIDPVVVKMPQLNCSAIRPKPFPSMVDSSFSNEVTRADPEPIPDPPSPIIETHYEPIDSVTPTEPRVEETIAPYVSYLSLALSGELLKRSLQTLNSEQNTAPKS